MPSWSLPSRNGMILGGISGIVMSIVIIIMWLIFRDTLDTDSMISVLESTGITEFRMYLFGMFYWIFLNSLLEEYVFRWFVTIKSIELLGSEVRAIILSATLFTLHHAIAMHYFGFFWWQTTVCLLRTIICSNTLVLAVRPLQICLGLLVLARYLRRCSIWNRISDYFSLIYLRRFLADGFNNIPQLGVSLNRVLE